MNAELVHMFVEPCDQSTNTVPTGKLMTSSKSTFLLLVVAVTGVSDVDTIARDVPDCSFK
jgi:hypothetical protein